MNHEQLGPPNSSTGNGLEQPLEGNFFSRKAKRDEAMRIELEKYLRGEFTAEEAKKIFNHSAHDGEWY